jgi:hypothetical protein
MPSLILFTGTNITWNQSVLQPTQLSILHNQVLVAIALSDEML